MNQQRLFELIEKLKNDLATEAEMQELDLLYNAFEKKAGYIDNLDEKQKETYREMVFGRIHSRINPVEQPNIIPANKTKNPQWTRILIAASVILCLSFGGYFLIQQRQTDQFADNAVNDITPGKNTATLTLAGGQKIILSGALNGKLAVQAGVTITKTANGQLVYSIKNNNATGETKSNTLSTGRGEQYQVVLPDGSHVWLNAASSLTFPASFAALKSREVKLAGEAYFEIAKDKAHPFIVITDRQQVQVLGTHFNINSYDDEPVIKTALLEGSVQVTETADNVVKVLRPGQQAVLTNSNLSISDANLEETVAWKNGDFDFNKENIQSIMRKLSRWYNIEVTYEGDVKSKTFTGKISRFKNISQVLKMLSKTKAVHFVVEERRVIVKE
ncbi:FecR family protein [Mucilaginibacter pineti]|uniref:FecR family protein n=1 Tax=Mucilaginibacter pineti TaxID=1391627 RepID=A0A1G7H3V4_9SPHI|nr:FecR family protein [Mucilaginibacter pineti]SDE95092.1 FecR family protein [Mucilaginibacter pineti]